MVGARTNRETAEIMLLGRRYDEAVSDALESKRHLPQQEIDKILQIEFDALVKHISTIKPTEENIAFIRWFWENINSGKIDIRIYPKETLHSKLYLIDYKDTRHGSGIAYIGSSNLSMSGFNLNTELNVAVHGDENHKYLSQWFDNLWQSSERADFTALAGQAIKKSWVMNAEITPFRVYLRILHEIFSFEEDKPVPDASYGEVELWDYQKDAVIDAYHRLQEFNGVFLADVPGLGKTYMGAALLAHLQEEGKRAIVISPPKVEDQWNDVLSEFGVGTARVFSHGKLDAILEDENMLKRQVVLIDEAHHFRNPETDRYKDMELICEGKQVILVGATPQNLDIMDLYHQIKLFTASEVNHKFRIEPVALHDYFKAVDKGEAVIEDLINQVVVRRTRSNILEFYGEDKLPHFPSRIGPKRIDYSIDEVYPGGIYKKLSDLIDQLKFARYDLGNYIKEGAFTPEESQRIKQAGKNLRKIMRIILFRRLESSIAAFRDSTLWMHRSHIAFLKALEQGKVLAGEAADFIYDQLKGGADLSDLEIPEDAYPAANFQTDSLEAAIKHDEYIFKEMYQAVADLKPADDDKLQTLISKLKKEIGNKKTIVFTQFASTATYLGEELANHFPKTDFVSQDTGHVLTKAKRFSPKSNKFKLNSHEEINLLVSTELLSEGLNLQDGQVIINYELHWNPVRIIQRIGRIDRIGSKHDNIWVYNFFPQEEVEIEINVEKKVKRRIDEIIKIYGADDKTITQDEEEVRKKLFKIYTEDERSLEEEMIESKSAYFRQEWLKLQRDFPDEYETAKRLPEMITSGKKSSDEGIAVFVRSDDYFRLMLAGDDGKIISRNDWDILPLIACEQSEKMTKLKPSHLEILDKVRRDFEDEVNIRESQRKDHLEKVKVQAILKLQKIKRGKSDKIKRAIDEAIGLVREAYLGPSGRRALRSAQRKHGLLTEEFLDEIRGIVADLPKEKPPQIEKKYTQVIVSESLNK